MKEEATESSFRNVGDNEGKRQVVLEQLGIRSSVHVFYKVQQDGRYFFRKALQAERLPQEYYREALRKEYELGRSLHSDHIVGYHSLTDTPGECAVLMDYVNGVTLTDFAHRHPHYFSIPANVQKFVTQVCLALQELHQHQALHLDLKPSNIMLTAVNNDVRLIDLGCSYTDARPDTLGLTRRYAAPEQLDDTGGVDARTDIYALGRILEELNEAEPLPMFYQRLMQRCLKPRKEERFQSVGEILDLLNKKKRALGGVTLTILFLLTGVIVLATLAWMGRRQPQETATAIADGTEFIDTVLQDTLYLRVLSATEHAVALVRAPQGGHTYQGDVVLPDSVVYRGETFYIRHIDDNAFRNCSLLTNVHFPPTLTAIGNSAFRGCHRLTSMPLPHALQRLGYEVFADCRTLNYAHWPASATEVPRNCFVGCDSLRSISLPEGVTTVHQDAFTGCHSLQDVDLPSTLAVIDRGAFYQCRSLSTITLPANIRELGEYLFYGCTSLEEVHVLAPAPPAISTLVDSTFRGRFLVPPASLDTYRKAQGWKHLDIQPLK